MLVFVNKTSDREVEDQFLSKLFVSPFVVLVFAFRQFLQS